MANKTLERIANSIGWRHVIGLMGLLGALEVAGLVLARDDGYADGYADGKKAKAAAEHDKGVAEGRFDAARAKPGIAPNYLEAGADYFNARMTLTAGTISVTYSASGKGQKLEEIICVSAPEETTCYSDTDFFYHTDDKNKHDGKIDRVIVARDGSATNYRRQTDYKNHKNFFDDADELFEGLKERFESYRNP